MSIKRVNRIATDGTTVTVTLGRHQIPCLKATYGDKIETSFGAELGSQQIDYRTRGNYSTEELTITWEYVRYHSEVVPLLQLDGFGNEAISVVVSETHPDLGSDSDMLTGCRMTGQKDSIENTNAARVVETTWTTDQVYWGEVRKTRNQRNLSLPLDASKF